MKKVTIRSWENLKENFPVNDYGNLDMGEYYFEKDMKSLCKRTFYLKEYNIDDVGCMILNLSPIVDDKEVMNLLKDMSITSDMVEENIYISTLRNFSGHKWVAFYENPITCEPHVEWAEGCHDEGLEGLENFEQRVEEEYSRDKNSRIYRQYMLESDKLRLALGLPARKIGIETKIYVANFAEFLQTKKDLIKDYIKEFANAIADGDDTEYYEPKNIMWLSFILNNANAEFKYLDEVFYGDNFYYDLITVEYLGQNMAIPVPVLAEILGVQEQTLYDCFLKHENREDVEFI